MKYLITSALPYINGIKHLGNLVGSLLPADVYARFLKQAGHEVLYICGTDEHGTPAEIAALEEELPVEEFCQQMYLVQKNIYESFDLDFSFFGRTSSAANRELTQSVFMDLWNQGFIIEESVPSFYSHVDQMYLPDRYIMGICPKCSYAKARGDQCDGCGSLLDPVDLREPFSSLSGDRALELRMEKHLFLDLEKLQEEVQTWLETKKEWSRLVLGIAEGWMKEGLRKRGITRSLKWGVPVPLKGYEDKVFYVWFDAPLGYISMTQEWAIAKGVDWRDWWQSPDVQLVQFLGKDNVPFHAIFWPAMMMGTRKPWHLADTIKSFSWLNYQGGKFSTSQKRGVFTDQALALFPADYWRYGLLAMAPESSDSDFSFAEFADVVNKDLADKLGNFINRVFTFTRTKLDGRISGEELHVDTDVRVKMSAIGLEYAGELSALRYRSAVSALRSAWSLGNEYFTLKEPWKLVKCDIHEARKVLGTCLYLAGAYCVLGFPIIPGTSRKVWASLGFTEDLALVDLKGYGQLWAEQSEIRPGSLEILFKKILPEDVAELSERFKGE